MKKIISKWIATLSYTALGLIILLSLLSFDRQDFPLYSSSPPGTPHNLIGILGVYLGGYLLFTFGITSYVFSLIFLLSALRKASILKFNSLAENIYTKTFFFAVLILSCSSFISLFGETHTRHANGGLIGFLISSFLLTYLGKTGAIIITLAVFSIATALLWTELFVSTAKFLYYKLRLLPNLILGLKKQPYVKNYKILDTKTRQTDTKKGSPDITPEKTKIAPRQVKEKPRITIKQKPTKEYAPKEFTPVTIKIQDMAYTLPTPSVLKDLPATDYTEINKRIEQRAKELEDTLSDFGISAKVVNAEKGPVVTRYELEPAPGVKINKISTLSDDIALSMKSTTVRVVAPIPGKGTVGIEVPNSRKNIVFLKEVVESKEFINSGSKLTLAAGKDVAGNPIILDLKDMPHVLVAGSTGSGKTVCLNSFLCSLLFKASPWEVKLLLIDPKMVEMTQYSKIPHLFAPIVSDAKKAANILTWAVEEMERRYSLLAEEGTRNIDMYNGLKGKEEQLPFIVIVVDELADLMLVARDQIETTILRLAQLSRAVGIHLILATQRPSADIITGVIRNNLPARVSFKVPSQVDSRVVLDFTGAEKLLGKGDLLYIGPGLLKPIRAQSSYIEDDDIHRLVGFITSQNIPTQYNQRIIDIQKRNKIGLGKDELLDEAIKLVLESGQASASMIQRRLRVGYTRAARLLDLMEEEAIVGPFQGSKARAILVDKNEYLSRSGENKPD